MKSKKIIYFIILFISICYPVFALKKISYGHDCYEFQRNILEALEDYNKKEENPIDYSSLNGRIENLIKELKNSGYLKKSYTGEKCSYAAKDGAIYCEYHGNIGGSIKMSPEAKREKFFYNLRFEIFYYTVYDPFPLVILVTIFIIIIICFFTFRKKQE